MPQYKDGMLANDLTNGSVVIYAANGSLKKNGDNVMGKGIGKQLAQMMPTFPIAMGGLVAQDGNVCHIVKLMTYTFISFPTKHNYWEEEDIELIKKSAERLATILEDYTGAKILMEYPLMSKEMRPDVLSALSVLGEDVCIYRM